MKDAERRAELMKLWLQHPLEKRTENDLLAFHGWLEQNRRELLKRGHGDPYHCLSFDLAGHIKRRTPKEMSDTAAEHRKLGEKMRNTAKQMSDAAKAHRKRVS